MAVLALSWPCALSYVSKQDLIFPEGFRLLPTYLGGSSLFLFYNLGKWRWCYYQKYLKLWSVSVFSTRFPTILFMMLRLLPNIFYPRPFFMYLITVRFFLYSKYFLFLNFEVCYINGYINIFDWLFLGGSRTNSSSSLFQHCPSPLRLVCVISIVTSSIVTHGYLLGG